MVIAILALLIGLSLVLALRRSHAGHGRSVLDFFVASRQLNPIALFCLAAGEMYGIGTLIGFPGGVYSVGATYAVWYIGYLLLAFPVGYFLAPRLWLAGKQYSAVTLPDLFKGHFSSRTLELVVAAMSIAFLIPWGQLQLIGVIVAIKVLGWHLPSYVVTTVTCTLSLVYVVVAGLRSSSQVVALKDGLLLIAIVATGAAAIAGAGGISPLFSAGGKQIVTLLSQQNLNFAMSTVVFQALGFYLIPLVPQALFSAGSPDILRRVHIVMPLYMLFFPFLLFTTYHAAMRPGAISAPTDIFLATALHVLPSWALGIVTAATALTGMFVLASTCLAISSLVVRNIVPSLPEHRQTRWARFTIAGFLIVCAALLSVSSQFAISLVNLTYMGVAQFLPGVAAILLNRKIRPVALIAGMVCGQSFAVIAFLAGYRFGGINIGAISLLINFATAEGLQIWLLRRHGQSRYGHGA